MRRYNDPTLSLHRLHHNGTGLFRGSRLDSLYIIVFHIEKTGRQGNIRLLKLGLPGGSYHSQSASMKGTEGGYNLVGSVPVMLSVTACQFNCALIGFGAAVTDKHLVQATVLHQNLRQLELGDSIELI